MMPSVKIIRWPLKHFWWPLFFSLMAL